MKSLNLGCRTPKSTAFHKPWAPWSAISSKPDRNNAKLIHWCVVCGYPSRTVVDKLLQQRFLSSRQPKILTTWPFAKRTTIICQLYVKTLPIHLAPQHFLSGLQKLPTWFFVFLFLPITFIFSNQSSTQKNQIVQFTRHPFRIKVEAILKWWKAFGCLGFPSISPDNNILSIQSKVKGKDIPPNGQAMPFLCVYFFSLSLSTWEVFGHVPTWHQILS